MHHVQAPSPAFSTTAPFQVHGKPLKVEGYSNVKLLQLGSLTKKQTIIALVALSVISILAAVLFSYVPGLSGLSSFLCGAVLLGVLLVTVIPVAKQYFFKKEVQKYLAQHEEEILNYFQNAESFASGWATNQPYERQLLEGHPPSLQAKILCFREARQYRLAFHEVPGTLKLRAKEFWVSARATLGE